jgi:hypothetical protein
MFLGETTAALARGASEGRVEHLRRAQVRNEMWELLNKLERQQHVHHLLAVARLLHVGDLAAAAIGDAGLRDLG